jgi:hypothetical protein
MPLSDAVRALERELRNVFGARLKSVVAYGLHANTLGPTRTMALVESVTEQDLRGCAARVKSWHAAGLATPLVLPVHEFEGSVDAFPLEFASMLADHVVVSGEGPFERTTVQADDIRRACEVRARGHLLHLREGFLEAGGNSNALAVLIVESAAPLGALLANLARLEGRGSVDPPTAGRHAERVLGVPGGTITDVVALVTVHEISAPEAERIFPTYLAAMERLVEYVDGWGSR